MADLIMCMMGLFVILWCLKPEGKPPTPESAAAQKQTQDEWMDNFRKGFGAGMGYQPDPTSPRNDSNPNMNGPGEKGKNEETTDGAQGTDRTVSSIRMGDTTVVGGRLTFAAGADALSEAAKRQLDQVAGNIKGHKQIVLVKGHTSLDDLAADASAEDRMALSVRRAKRVQDYLISRGVEPEVLRVVGCSTFEPVVQRAPAPQHSQNRRVEVEVTPNLVTQFQDAQPNAKQLDDQSSK
ncbi:MAG: OmpA family protein [Tepidisphaeraceae bacterium]